MKDTLNDGDNDDIVWKFWCRRYTYHGMIRTYHGMTRTYHGMIGTYYGMIRLYYVMIRAYYGMVRICQKLSYFAYNLL